MQLAVYLGVIATLPVALRAEVPPETHESQPALKAGWLAYQQGDLAAAIPVYEQAAQANPHDASLWYDLGCLLALHHDWANAREALTKAHELDPRLAVTFQYPIGWKIREERGHIDSYSQVRFLGPRNAEDTYSCYLAVRVTPVKASGGRHDSVEALAQNYKAHIVEGGRVEREGVQTVASRTALDLTIMYTMPPTFHRDVKPIPIPIKTRTVMLQKEQDLYEFIYSADTREYDQRMATFEQLLNTIRFQ